MCLDRINNSIKDQLPDKIKAYKVVESGSLRLYAPIYSYVYRIGVNSTILETLMKKFKWTDKYGNDYKPNYIPYFHVFRNRTAAKKWAGKCEVIIPVYIDKKDVTTTGYQKRSQVLVTKKFTILKEDYHKALKGSYEIWKNLTNWKDKNGRIKFTCGSSNSSCSGVLFLIK